MVKIPLEIVVDSLFTQFRQEGSPERPEQLESALVSIPVTRRADGKITVRPSHVDSACPVDPQEWASEETVFSQPPPPPKPLCWEEVVCCSERIAAAVMPVKVRQCATHSET